MNYRVRLGLFRRIWGICLLREVCLLELFDVHDEVIVVISFIFLLVALPVCCI
jgi:hypothetical protein